MSKEFCEMSATREDAVNLLHQYVKSELRK